MYAVIQVGSLQYKVSEGDVIDANRIRQDQGKDVILDKVLLFANDMDVRIGQPYLPDVKVTAKVVGHSLGEKLVAYKFRKRKNSATKKGHRQKRTVLKITKIMA